MENLLFLGVPILKQIRVAVDNEALLCLSFGISENNEFSFGTNGKFIIFRCPST